MICQKCEEEIGKKDECIEVSQWIGNLRETQKHYHKNCLEEENSTNWKGKIEQFLDSVENYAPMIKSFLGFVPDKSKKKEK